MWHAAVSQNVLQQLLLGSVVGSFTCLPIIVVSVPCPVMQLANGDAPDRLWHYGGHTVVAQHSTAHAHQEHGSTFQYVLCLRCF